MSRPAMLIDELFDELNDIASEISTSDGISWLEGKILDLRDRWAKVLADDASPFNPDLMSEVERYGSVDLRVTLDIWKEVEREDLDLCLSKNDPDRRLRWDLFERVIGSIRDDVDFDDPSDMRVTWIPRDPVVAGAPTE